MSTVRISDTLVLFRGMVFKSAVIRDLAVEDRHRVDLTAVDPAPLRCKVSTVNINLPEPRLRLPKYG